jgi:uncharacterized YccA/Bax inhibitor family protein
MSNPALREDLFTRTSDRSEAMTIEGTTNKTFVLLALAILTASYTWEAVKTGGIESVYGFMIGGVFTGLVVAIILAFKAEWSMALAPVYALAEGLFLGGISSYFETLYPGIAVQAVSLTLAAMATMLLLYRTGVIKVTETFRSILFVATASIGVVYLVTLVLNMFGVSVPYIHGNGIIGIGFSLFVIGIAAFNLILDFDFIENSAKYGAPKYMEWYSAFALMVTLVWLYLEILRLLSKLNSRD